MSSEHLPTEQQWHEACGEWTVRAMQAQQSINERKTNLPDPYGPSTISMTVAKGTHMNSEQQWRDACAQWHIKPTDLYAPDGLIDNIRHALWHVPEPDEYGTTCREGTERAGACVRALRGDDTWLPDVPLAGVVKCLHLAMHQALWSDDMDSPAERSDLALCESWLYAAWRQLRRKVTGDE